VKFHIIHQYSRWLWAGQHSQYNDWVRARQSGDQIPVGARFSAPVQARPGAHPASCTMGTGSFPGVKRGRGMTLTPHPLLVLWSRKGRAIPLLPPVGRMACVCTVELYLYSPCGPYGLYRASVSVQGCIFLQQVCYFTITGTHRTCPQHHRPLYQIYQHLTYEYKTT
jgi:hypothetical protein